MYYARVLQVLVTSPGDVPKSMIDGVIDSIEKWNKLNSVAKNIILKPVRWETDVYSNLNNEEPQKIINTQIVADSDILIGVFWTRIGTPTKEYESGSVEEIEKHIGKKKPAMLYFLKKQVPIEMFNDAELKYQFDKLQGFKRKWSRKGVYKDINVKSNVIFDDLSLLLNDRNKELARILHLGDFNIDSIVKEDLRFRYHFLPTDDGERIWIRQSAYRWIEKSPNSAISDKVFLCYSESESIIKGVRGMIVQCATRDEEIGFQVFIPEKNDRDMWLYCRIVNKRGSDWERLGVTPIEYY